MTVQRTGTFSIIRKYLVKSEQSLNSFSSDKAFSETFMRPISEKKLLRDFYFVITFVLLFYTLSSIL